MTIRYVGATSFQDADIALRKGDRRQAEKALAEAAEDGVITEREQDDIMDQFRTSRGVVRDVYLETAGKLAARGQPPSGLGPLIERMEKRDLLLDEAAGWGDQLIDAVKDGSLSAEDRAALLSAFLTLSKQAQRVVGTVLPAFQGVSVADLVVDLQVAMQRAV